MIRKRPEKDMKNPPGQIKEDITLKDYIDRKTAPQWPFPTNIKPKKRLTFDEWWDGYEMWSSNHDSHYEKVVEEVAKAVWKAAQENM